MATMASRPGLTRIERDYGMGMGQTGELESVGAGVTVLKSLGNRARIAR